MSATSRRRRPAILAQLVGVGIVALSFVMLALADAAAQEDVGPIDARVAVAGYKATVVAPSAYLRSGPSHANYPTEKLVRGDTVEVYRTAAGGWVGVRPTPRSFCWIPGSAVQPDAKDPTHGIVAVDGVEAWIGSNVERVKRHESQVALHAGEEVQILGHKAAGEQGESWCKIAAPAGEFRWIHSKHLSSKSVDELAADDARAEIERARRLIERGARDPDELPGDAWSDRSPQTAANRNRPPRKPRPTPDRDERADDVERADYRDNRTPSHGDVERAQFVQRIRDRFRGRGQSTGAVTKNGTPRSDDDAVAPPVIGRGSRTSKPSKNTNGDPGAMDITEEEAEAFAAIDGQEIVVDEETAKDEAKLTEYLKSKARGARREQVTDDVAQDDSREERRDPDAGGEFDPGWARRRRARAPRDPSRGEIAGEDPRQVDPEFRRRIDKWESDLTIEASRNPAQWNMAALRERGERLLAQARTPLERGIVRLTLDRIVAFESTSPGGPAAPVDRQNLERDPAKMTQRDRSRTEPPNANRELAERRLAPAPRPSLEDRYDAVGVLMPVYDNQRKGLPPYQLVDEDGNLIRYVTPEPGVNLRRYERKTVGLTGPRGYIETLQRDHLTARSVVDLERTRR